MTGVGLCLPQLGMGVTGSIVREFCERAEELGFTSLWVQEHMIVPVEPVTGYAGIPGVPIPAPYRSTLAALELLTAAAAWTRSVRIGTSVIVGGYHRPVELAQRLATVDVISGGRLVVGLGIGWSPEEHEHSDVAMGIRGSRMDELVEALVACWSDDPISYEGEHFRIPPCYLNPKPVQRPHPPLVSGMWSERGLDRTSRLFDGWNPTMGTPADVAAAVEAMNATRPDGAAPLSVWDRVFHGAPLSGPQTDPEPVFQATREAAELGFEEVIIDANFNEEVDDPTRWLDLLEVLAPAVKVAKG